MTKTITKQQYWQITGLLALAQTTVSRLKDIESSIRAVLEVEQADEDQSGVGDPDHIGDAIYCEYSPDTLLEKLGISQVVESTCRHHRFTKECYACAWAKSTEAGMTLEETANRLQTVR